MHAWQCIFVFGSDRYWPGVKRYGKFLR